MKLYFSTGGFLYIPKFHDFPLKIDMTSQGNIIKNYTQGEKENAKKRCEDSGFDVSHFDKFVSGSGAYFTVQHKLMAGSQEYVMKRNILPEAKFLIESNDGGYISLALKYKLLF